MKRLISLLLALLMVFALVACGDEAVTDTSSRDASDSDGGSSATSSENGGETDEYDPVKYLNGLSFDEDLEHRIVTIDVLKGSIVVLDLDRGNGDFTKLSDKSAVVWEASVPYACDSGIKFRESELFGDVFLATGSGGDAIAVSYKTKEVVWNVSGIYNAHSIEMLPNGDIIVAASGDSDDDYSDGGLHYFPAGSRKKSAFLSLPYAHAVHWDPENNCLWSIGFEGIVSVIVDGEGEDATMVKDPDKCYEMTNFTGHDLAPVYGLPGSFWVSDNKKVYRFDSNTMELLSNASYTSPQVKGIAYFADGTMICAPAGLGSPIADCYTAVLRICSKASASSLVKRKDVTFSDRQFYKVHTFTSDYV